MGVLGFISKLRQKSFKKGGKELMITSKKAIIAVAVCGVLTSCSRDADIAS